VATPREVSRRLRNALVASNPGLLRLRLAGTATASMVASLGVMTGIARLTGQPVTAVLLGVIVSMVAARRRGHRAGRRPRRVELPVHHGLDPISGEA
jgi:hypothetical protein